MAKRSPDGITTTGKAIKAIMDNKGMGTNALADAMGKTPSTVCDRIYQKNISIDKLDEIVRVLGYKIMLVPRGTKGEGFYDVG